MKFWIVTPSYNQLNWLKLCIASVRDQVASASDAVDDCSLMVDKDSPTTHQLNNSISPHAIRVHHHVQDAKSSDGTPEWLAEYVTRQSSTGHYQLTFASEADEGMYDAINRGWRQAPEDVDVIAHLNCDEQYLPGALRRVADFFSKHRKAEVVLADMIVVDRNGEYICHRRSLRPYRAVSAHCCGGFTATTFQRVSVIREKEVFFDTRWRNFGDKVWYNALHKAGCRFAVCNQLVAAFTDTGENLNWTEQGRIEKRRYEEEFLGGSGAGTNIISRVNGLRRIAKELLVRPPLDYSIYRSPESPRETVSVLNPTGLWHKKWKQS